MNTERVTRKLSAILSADVEGYSRLMGDDEVATVRTLEAYRKIFADLIEQHIGRVVDSPGDNILAEFGSVVDAVQCAVEVQQILKAKNAELSENRTMQFRIGVNLGDVIQEGDRIYGDGVNIAARIEGLAEAGGICVSGSAYEQIENKLALGYEYFGEHTVKNIARPIKVYKVPMEPRPAKRPKTKTWKKVVFAAAVFLILGGGGLALWNFYFRPPPVEVVTEAEMAFPLPDKPSIAVLPFVNVSGDPGQEYIADGITEQIIATLARNPHLFVIAGNSTFTYKGKPVKVQQVSRELGVRYVVEGSVQKSGDRIRITAQLIDATTGEHIWAKTYDRDLKEIFALQDEITLKILKAVSAKVYGRETDQTLAKGTNNTEAYLKILKASTLTGRNQRNHRLAQQIFEEAITLDPEYASAYGSLARSYLVGVISGWSQTPGKDLRKAFELAQKAISLDQSLAGPHAVLGWIYLQNGNHGKAIAEARRALDLAPNDYFIHNELGAILTWADRLEEAISEIKEGFRLNPFPTWVQLKYLADAYYMSGRYKEALAVYKKMQKLNPDNEWAHINPIAIYVHLGRDKEASAAAKELLRINPTFPVEYWEKWPGFKNKERAKKWISALRKAGLDDKPHVSAPENPSIAVLPFANISGDPKEDYLSDGITENIITALSKTPKVLVIARNSVFTYKGKPVMVQQVSEELGVRYVLEGSVQRSGDRLRITAQLIDAKTGNHIWSDRYDRELKDLFAIQDDITMRVIEGLRVKLTEGEQGRIYSRGTDNLDAYLKVLKALDLVLRFRSKEDNALGRQMYEEAIALDPGYSNAYACLAFTYEHDVTCGWTKTPKKSLNLMLENAQKAVSLDESNPNAHMVLESAYRDMDMLDKALAEGKKAIALAPNGADTNANHSFTLLALGRDEEALATINKAIHLNPITPMWYRIAEGQAYMNVGQYEEAIAANRKALLLNPDFLWARVQQAMSYSLAGQEEKARAEAKEILRINPKFSVDWYVKAIFMSAKKRDREALYINALRKAGLK